MLYRDETFVNGDRLLIWKMDESAEELLPRFTTLRDEYSDTISTFRSKKRVQEFLSVRYLLRIALGHDVRVSYDEKGKPSLSEEAGLHISISHTKDYAALFLSGSRGVGIDIEQMSDKIFRVKNKFLNEAERGLLDETDKVPLLLGWSAKEAVYKLVPGLKADYWEQVFVTGISWEDSRLIVDIEGVGALPLRFCVEEDFVMVYN